MREEGKINKEKLKAVFLKLSKDFPKDWLLALELYELAKLHQDDLSFELHSYLMMLKKNSEFSKLIENGLKLL